MQGMNHVLRGRLKPAGLGLPEIGCPLPAADQVQFRAKCLQARPDVLARGGGGETGAAMGDDGAALADFFAKREK